MFFRRGDVTSTTDPRPVYSLQKGHSVSGTCNWGEMGNALWDQSPEAKNRFVDTESAKNCHHSAKICVAVRPT